MLVESESNDNVEPLRGRLLNMMGYLQDYKPYGLSKAEDIPKHKHHRHRVAVRQM